MLLLVESEKCTHCMQILYQPPLLFIYCPFARGSKNYIGTHIYIYMFAHALLCVSIFEFQLPFSNSSTQNIKHNFLVFHFDDRYLGIHNDAFDDTTMKMRKYSQHSPSVSWVFVCDVDKHHFRWPNTKFSSVFCILIFYVNILLDMSVWRHEFLRWFRGIWIKMQNKGLLS